MSHSARTTTPARRFTAHIDATAARDADDEIDDQPFERPLLALGAERATPRHGCHNDPCDKPELDPTDLYCKEHEKLIPFSQVNLGRARWFVINLVRAAVCGAVVLAALVESTIPLFVLFVVVGVVIGAAPLHRFPMTAKVAIVAWLLAGLVAGVLPLLSSTVESVVRAVLVGLVLMLAVVHAGAYAWSVRRSRFGTAAAVTVAALAVVPAMATGWLLSNPSVGFTSVPDRIRTWLLIGIATGAAGAMLIAAIAGAVTGQSRVDTLVKEIVSARATAWAVNWQAKARSVVGLAALQRALMEFADRVRAVMVATARGMVNLLLRAAHIVQVVGCRLINWSYRQAVIALRRIAAAVVGTAEVLVRALLLGWLVAGRTSRVIVVPAVAVAAGAAAAVLGADYALRYLLDEGLGVLGPLALVAVGGLLALTLLWISLSGLPLIGPQDQQGRSGSVFSWGRSATISAPHLIVAFTLGGWIVGLPGTLGHGPIKLGPVTITSTVLLIAVLAWTWRSGGGDPEQPD